MGGHDSPPILLGQLDGGDGLGDGTDLIHLQEQGVSGAVWAEGWCEEFVSARTDSFASSLSLLPDKIDSSEPPYHSKFHSTHPFWSLEVCMFETYPFSAASWIFFGLVTVKSSPTTCRSFVTPVVNLIQLSQSS